MLTIRHDWIITGQHHIRVCVRTGVAGDAGAGRRGPGPVSLLGMSHRDEEGSVG